MEPSTDSLTQELEAMAAIGDALASLSDPAMRQRVLRWAAERFGTGTLPQTLSRAAEEPVVAAVASADPCLAIDSLSDMFGATVVVEEIDDYVAEAPVAAVSETTQPLDVMLRSFAADFLRLTEEWKGATAA
jgi:hypothetical protein